MKKISLAVLSFATPFIAFAAPNNLSALVKELVSILNALIPLIFGIAIVVFLWGIVKFFFINSDDSGSRDEGKKFMIWGIIALFVMVGFWGFVNILNNTFFNSSINEITSDS